MPGKLALIGPHHMGTMGGWLLPRERGAEATSLSQPNLGSHTQSLVTQVSSIECVRDYTRGVNTTR